jgi:16S rRNA (guanine527-N7)-methyltransferase
MNSILNYFPTLTDRQTEQIRRLQELYSFWNSQINVISRKDIENLYINHVLHSLGIAKLVSFKNQTTILDVGTGGGFPGIPLAILFPNVHFHLIDSIGKKVKVAQNIAQELELSNVECTQIRAEELKNEYDFIVSRAVTSLPVFYNWVKKRIASKSFNSITNGILYLKGGNVDEEIKQIPCQTVSYPINIWFKEDYFFEKYIVHIPYSTL